ncbi:uncharacterized protein LAESUDRAFT_718311 [Laetiporus sulphureus 93-53]|uniref:Uncharacterized protein n=1 Tax=Laetiporus sulphureus 93-53 TaxID=1314785 RepID=A0A165B3C2_9APHY|nr:uncharacterized protein LAESUDRAFT_718311 [Laetiporus sulphureus 93-53]KZT00143.1 hypothetical protein LAESUDRAFT_718311 [Laetiporus sulphureus 93-53]
MNSAIAAADSSGSGMGEGGVISTVFAIAFLLEGGCDHKRVLLSSTTSAASSVHSRLSSSAHGATSAENLAPSRLGGHALFQPGSALPSTQSKPLTASLAGARAGGGCHRVSFLPFPRSVKSEIQIQKRRYH